jgi:hypothetical protein
MYICSARAEIVSSNDSFISAVQKVTEQGQVFLSQKIRIPLVFAHPRIAGQSLPIIWPCIVHRAS